MLIRHRDLSSEPRRRVQTGNWGQVIFSNCTPVCLLAPKKTLVKVAGDSVASVAGKFNDTQFCCNLILYYVHICEKLID